MRTDNRDEWEGKEKAHYGGKERTGKTEMTEKSYVSDRNY